MPETKIYSEGWVATVLSSPHKTPEGFFQVLATTEGASKEAALAGAEYVLNAFAFGRIAFIREKPEANSEKDFDTKINHHKGFVRFSYKLEAGEWFYRDETEQAFVGFGQVA